MISTGQSLDSHPLIGPRFAFQVPLNRQGLYFSPTQRQIEQPVGHVDGCEYVRQQAHSKRDGESTDRPGAELKEKCRRDQRGQMGIEDGPKNFCESSIDR